MNLRPKIVFPRVGVIVKSPFLVIGWVPKICVSTEYPLTIGISGEGFGMNIGRPYLLKSIFANLQKGFWFWSIVNTSWLKHARNGEIITLELSGYDGKNFGDIVRVPLALQVGSERPKLKRNQVIENHSEKTHIGERLEEYRRKMGEVYTETECVINPHGKNLVGIIIPEETENIESLQKALNKDSNLRIQVTAEGRRRKELKKLSHEYEKELATEPIFGATGGETPVLDLVLQVSNLIVSGVFVWAIKHAVGDLDNALWLSVKNVFKKLFSRASEEKKRCFAFVVEGYLVRESLAKRTLIFFFEASLSETQLKNQLDKLLETLQSLDTARLGAETHMIFEFQNQSWVSISHSNTSV